MDHALLAVALAAPVVAFWVGYERGRAVQQAFDVRWIFRRQEKLMADFSLLQVELGKLLAYVQAPRPEDPSIQQQIDALAAQVKAVNDVIQPPT